MSDGNEKLREAVLESKLSAKDAGEFLEKVEKEERNRRAQQEFESFQAGLMIRNILAFIVFATIFLAIAS